MTAVIPALEGARAWMMLAAVLAVAAAAGIGGYRLGHASADREAVAQMRGERDAWKGIADESLQRERQWLSTAGSIQSRWESALEDIRAIQSERPVKTIREVIREGATCPDVSIDPGNFRVLDSAVRRANAARREAEP